MTLTGDTAAPAQREKPAAALKLNFLSHGTLESRDLAFSRRFYEEFLGLEVVQTSRSLLSFDWAAATRLPSSTARMSEE
jgi:catechol-2,3-dioxygenase